MLIYLEVPPLINSIDEHLEQQRVLEIYLKNKTKRRAVEREIEIIGEAMSKILKINQQYRFPTQELLLI